LKETVNVFMCNGQRQARISVQRRVIVELRLKVEFAGADAEYAEVQADDVTCSIE
jgi:hypothetical protein